ncbi:MAG: hypothetical protein GXO72_01850 [Caldiserica bacterium]|nr:hypothetical protein [Caldisericota bacterium]
MWPRRWPIIIHHLNDHRSANKWIYRTRWLEARLAEAVRPHPVTVLTGARPGGKSTLLRHAGPVAGWRYLSLDDPGVPALAEEAPDGLWAGAEVDFAVGWGRSLVAFEVKLGKTVHYADAKALRLFLSGYPGCRAGILIYCGDEVLRLGRRIAALPWRLLAGLQGPWCSTQELADEGEPIAQ